MKRWPLVLGAGVLLVLFAGSPAYAQYGGGGGGDTTTTTTSSTTTPPTTDAPPPNAVPGSTTNDTPAPGSTVPITAPGQGGNPVLDPTKPAAAVLVPADGGPDIPAPQPTITQGANGAITITVTVPANTPPGVYIIAVIGTDSKGVTHVVLVPVVVRANVGAATLGASGPSGPAATLPTEVRKIVATIGNVGGAAAVEDAVLHGASLSISGGQLVLHSTNDRPGRDSRPLVAALAVALAGGGLVLLRRRTPAISKRSN
jgi:hypothetical protein